MTNEAKARIAARKPTPGQLIAVALEARKQAIAPYSKFKVGAAVLTRSGKIIGGANVESASYGLTCCAERVALFKGLTGRESDFVPVAVVARVTGGAMPCGACRHLLAEYAGRAKVFGADSRRTKIIKKFSVRELLPNAFRAGPGFPVTKRRQKLIQG